MAPTEIKKISTGFINWQKSESLLLVEKTLHCEQNYVPVVTTYFDGRIVKICIATYLDMCSTFFSSVQVPGSLAAWLRLRLRLVSSMLLLALEISSSRLQGTDLDRVLLMLVLAEQMIIGPLY